MTANTSFESNDDSNGQSKLNPVTDCPEMHSGGTTNLEIGADVDINVQESVKITSSPSEELNNNAAASEVVGDVISHSSGPSPCSADAANEEQMIMSTISGLGSSAKFAENLFVMDPNPPSDKREADPQLDDSGNTIVANEGENSASDPEKAEKEDYTQHIAASLVNNTLAIMLLIDHKL